MHRASSIHIRIHQRNSRKTLTTVQGIADVYDKKKLLKAFKKKFACNGSVIEHPEYGEVIQPQGDQCKNICQFLVQIGLAKDDQLKVHGGFTRNMAGIVSGGMVEQVNGAPDQGRAPVPVIEASLWWLLKILCSHTSWSHLLVLVPSADAGPAHTCCQRPGPAPITWCHQWVRVVAAALIAPQEQEEVEKP
ncbi:hypothetical protein QTO34_016748 [Cnephaeus nilssonii]|uniref:SUI1 domain-containing protein n=1 Tax=Cnephaeus nilssonii TaxID=3371016 RepID=A0AA40I2W8_CNENI|nr:hypothetical protein QTO34_016748 [Eptesicus nilssonii]